MEKKLWLGIGAFFGFILICTIMAITAYAATDPPGKFGGTLRVATEEEVAIWDVHRTTSVLVRKVVQHFAEKLFAEDENFKPVPMLAQDYTVNPEKTVYTLNLRRGVLFHNGKEMTSEDVVASLNRWGQYGPLGSMVYKFVDKTEAVDRYTVKINLKKPCGLILTGLATHRQGAFIFPKEVLEKVGDGYLKPEADILIGTGPYKFKEFQPDRYTSLVRFDKYQPREEPSSGYGGRRIAYFDEIRFIPVRDATVRSAGIETGEFHHAMGISLRDYDRLSKNPDVNTIVGPPWYPAIIFNMNKGLMADKLKLRQAIQTALDIGQIMKAAVGVERFYRLDPSVMWKETAWWTDVGQPYYNVHDIEKAKKLIAESGYNGEPIRWISTRDYPVLFDASFAAVTQLKKIGLNIDHSVVDWGTLTKIRKNPDMWEVILIMTSYRTEPALNVYHSPSWINGWKDPAKDALREQFIAEPDPVKRYALWEKIETLYYEKAPWLKLGDYFTLDAQRKTVKGYIAMPEQYFINAWLEE